MKKISSLVLSLILGTSVASFAEEYEYKDTGAKKYKYQISIDSNKQTAFTGADLSASVMEAYRQIEDSIGMESNSLNNILLVFPRILIAETINTFQHEVFGHGARAREFGWEVTTYKVDFGGGGSTSYLRPVNANYQKRAAMSIAGMQATEVLSYKYRDRFLDSHKISPVHGAAYFASSFDQVGYVMMTKYGGKSHDVSNYMDNMNAIYGKNYITKSKIKQRTWLSVADPYLFYSLYALGARDDFEYPMIEMGSVGYLPGFRAVFTPYGLENKMINYFRTDYTPFQVSFSQGKHKTGKSFKGELSIDKLYSTDNVIFGVNLAAWKQPKLFVADVKKAPNKIGYMGEAKANLRLGELASLYGAAGYKTSGFMIGQSLKSSAMLRVGLAFDF